MQLRVDASADAVRAALADGLSPADFEGLAIAETEKERDPFEADDRGEAVTFMTIVSWTAQAAVSGVVGSIAYDALKSAKAVLVEKFGKDRVAEDDDTEA